MTDYHSIKKQAIEMGIRPDEALALRRRYLTDKIRMWSDLLQEARENPSFSTLEKRLAKEHIDEALKELKRLQWECTKLSPEWIDNQGEVNKETIARAKAYPIERLLPYPVKNNMTRCPFHNDQHPSATTKGNFLWCFVCSDKGWDTIALLMELQNLTFREAVLDLSQR